MTENQTKKKSGLSCLFKLAILVLIVIIAAYAAVQIFFPAEKIRAEIVKRASESLGRHVELDDVSLSILPKLTLDLKGLRIYNPENFPGGELVSIDRLSCGMKLMPLLRKQFVFDEIIVDHPVLRLRKDKYGVTNYDFEIDAGEEGIQTLLGQKEKLSTEEAAISAFAFDWAEIKNGDLLYVDDSSDIQVTLNNFSLETRLDLEPDGITGHSVGKLTIPALKTNLVPENIPLDLEVAYNADVDFRHADLILKETTLRVNGIPFEVTSTVRNFLDLQSVFASLKADNVELEPLIEYLPPTENFDRSKLRLAGKVSGEVEIRLEFDSENQPYLAGAFDLKDLTAGYLNVSNRVFFENLHLDFDMAMVSFKSMGGKLSDQPFELSGAVKNWEDPIYHLKTQGTYSLIGLLPFMDPQYNHDISGLLYFDLDMAGQKTKWMDTDISGNARLERLFYNNDSLTSPLDRLDMALTFKGQGVIIDSLYAEYPGVRLSLTGSLKNGFAHLIEPNQGHKKPYLDFNMRAPLINYDVLIPAEELETKSEVMASGPGASSEIAAPIFIPDIQAGGKVFVDTLLVRGIKFSGITADVSYDNGIITYRNGNGTLYSGTVISEGKIDINDLEQPAVSASFTGNNIEANGFMAQFAGVDGHLFGKMNINGTLNGKGSELEDFINSLSADGDLSITEGKLVNIDLVQTLSNQFGFKTLEEEDLRDLATALKIREGKLLLDGTRLITEIGDWDLKGTIAFLDQKLDLDVGLYLSKEYAQKLNLADFLGGLLQDEQGRMKINFDLTGTYKEPRISNLSTDKAAVTDKAKDALKDGAEQLLQNLFKKKKK